MEFDPRPKRKRATRAEAEEKPPAAGESSRQLRPYFWNRLVGLSLLPFVCIFCKALYDTLTHAHGPKHRIGVTFWDSHNFGMFSAGAGVWLVIFCGSLKIWKVPLLLRAYVFGHELMHALMAKLSRGRIKEYRISSDGGYIVTDKYNFIIALGPYLWPFYSVPVLALWSLSFWWRDAMNYRDWFLGALGFSWMFHFTFTVWILPHGQTDFHGPGRIFSYLFIILANTITLSGALIILAPDITWHEYGVSLRESAVAFYKGAGLVLAWLIHWLGGIVRELAG